MNIPVFGASEGTIVIVKFPENAEWKGIFEEIEKMPAEPLKVVNSSEFFVLMRLHRQ